MRSSVIRLPNDWRASAASRLPRRCLLPRKIHADIALTEIINGKLEFEFNSGETGNTEVVEFPAVIVSKKNKKAA